ADERSLLPEQPRKGSSVAIHQNALQGSSRNPLRNQLAERALGLLTRFHNSHTLTARRAVCFQYRWQPVCTYPRVQRTRLRNEGRIRNHYAFVAPNGQKLLPRIDDGVARRGPE